VNFSFPEVVCLMPLTFNVVLESYRSADSLRRSFEF
jgi:hypothetical protein